jgi:hypothetical protein
MTYKSFLFSRRVFRWSFLTYFSPRVDFSHSLAMESTPPNLVMNAAAGAFQRQQRETAGNDHLLTVWTAFRITSRTSFGRANMAT